MPCAIEQKHAEGGHCSVEAYGHPCDENLNLFFLAPIIMLMGTACKSRGLKKQQWPCSCG
jgi:hypothetical protein